MPSRKRSKLKSNQTRSVRPVNLDTKALWRIIDELEFINLMLGVSPDLMTLARTVHAAEHEDPRQRDPIAEMGHDLAGIDIDEDNEDDDVPLQLSGSLIDVIAAPSALTDAVRWRLHRLTRLLIALASGRKVRGHRKSSGDAA